MKIILISGKSCAGKDQLGIYLKENFEKENKRVLTIHFGDAVKFFLTKYYNWDGNKDEYGRSMLQKLGTDIMRKHFPTYWADLVSKFIYATKEDWDFVIIPDWRFVNELKQIKKFNNNVTTIRINRLNEDGTYFENPSFTKDQLSHPSECELDDYYCDWYVNNTSLEEVKEQANIITEQIGD